MSKNNLDFNSKINDYYLTILKKLHSKYNSFENSYELMCINNLIYTENCHIVARFKDFLYLDDSTEFLNKFFPKNDLTPILTKTFNFYAKYCKVFPNYMILPENEYLYRNLRKKQKMIDQFNEIKREEEENRKHLKLKKNKDNENDYILFNKKVQESIERYKPSFTQSTIIMMDYINFNNNDTNDKKDSKILKDINDSKKSITISLNNNTNNYDLNDINSSELTLISIANAFNTTPKKNENNKISYTPPKKKINSIKVAYIEPKTINDNKKFISHFQNVKNKTKSNNIENINRSNNINNNNNITQKKQIKNNISNNNFNTEIKKNMSNFSQSKTSNNLFISSLQKTNKEKNSKILSKNIKSNIKKKKLYFTTTEKALSNKRPIYNYKTKKIDKNSNSTNMKKLKKNNQELTSISIKPSISPPNNKINSLKFKIIDSMISKNSKSNIIIYNSNNFINKNNLSSVINSNKTKNSIQINEYSEIDKINISKNKAEKNISKSNLKKNTNNVKKTVKEIMNNYKNIIKTRKNSHYSQDINKNNIFLKKNIISNLNEKSTIQKNKSNKKGRKTEPLNKYISPVNKNEHIIKKNPKTPLKSDIISNNKFQRIINKTKQASQTKIQNFIKKIMDENKKNYFVNQYKIKQNLMQ